MRASVLLYGISETRGLMMCVHIYHQWRCDDACVRALRSLYVSEGYVGVPEWECRVTTP
jgi:hypothetical protein